METQNLLLSTEFDEDQMSDIQENVMQLKQALVNSTNDTPTKTISLNIVFRILSRHDEDYYCEIELLGLPAFKFVLHNRHFPTESFNICYFATDIELCLDDLIFRFSPKTKYKTLFYDFTRGDLEENAISKMFDFYHNQSMLGYFKNNMVQYENISDFNEKSSFGKIQGIVIKRSVGKECIVLKLLDVRNMIDTFKVFVNFRNEETFTAFKDAFPKGYFVVFENNVKKIINKTMKLVYSINFNKLTSFNQTKVKNIELKQRLTTKNRIMLNVNNAFLKTTELVNVLPYTFHRGICKMVVKLIKLFFIDIKLFCSACNLSAKRCKCIESKLDIIDVFASMIVQNSGILMYATLKTQKNFLDFFDISKEEELFIYDYLRKFGDLKYVIGEFVDFNSKKAALLPILEKLTSYKIIYGRFTSKVKERRDGGQNVNYFNMIKFKNGLIYPNGSIKVNKNRNTINFIFDFKIKHVEKDQQQIKNERFALLKSKLLI